MKIAMIVPGGVDRSGEERVIPALLALIRRVAARHELHVFATRQEPAPGAWLLEGARIHNLGRPRTARRAISMVMAEHARAPFDVIQSIWADAGGALAVGLGALLRRPCLVHVAGGEPVWLPEIHYGGTRSWHGRLRLRAVLHRATRITAASRPMLDLIAARGVTALRVPLGVDLERWPLSEPVRRHPDSAARLVHVASLNRVKDQPTLLRALALLKQRGHDFRADVIGEDTLDGRIQSLASELGIADRIEFHGFLPQRRLRPIVAAAHLSIVSSLHEAGPVAMLEAAAVGVPTVGTSVGHVAEWSPDAAIAVHRREPVALAAAIESLLVNEDRRLALAGNARALAGAANADETALAFERLYTEVTGSARNASAAIRESAQ